MGNTCYMNAALQCVLHTAPLAAYFLSDLYRREKSRDIYDSAATAIHDLILKFDSNISSYAYERPTDIRYAIGKEYPQFQEYDQQDSCEFLLILLDKISKELNRGNVKAPYEKLEQGNKSAAVLVHRYIYIY
jgi:ubiquitin carboxyl-terminal hydrolase 4/11/15